MGFEEMPCVAMMRERYARHTGAMQRPRLVGINHIALEVGDIDEALAFYGAIFEIELRGRGPRQAFIDMGDQFINLTQTREKAADGERHFGLVVDDKEAVRAALRAAGVKVLRGRFMDFRDPWGNRVQVVDYRDIQFSKTPGVLRAMGLDGLDKHPGALAELRERGFGEP
jgi:catechol 2,3-dioxygenase-like lactoylglutathione lyase family enzyme